MSSYDLICAGNDDKREVNYIGSIYDINFNKRGAIFKDFVIIVIANFNHCVFYCIIFE